MKKEINWLLFNEKTSNDLNTDETCQAISLGYWLAYINVLQEEIPKIIFNGNLVKNKIKSLENINKNINDILFILEKIMPFNEINSQLKVFLIKKYKAVEQKTRKTIV